LLKTMLVILSGAVPVLVRVTVWGALLLPTRWLPKFKLGGARLTAGSIPVPESVTVCGLPGASSVIVRTPLRAPVAVAVKVTLIVQLPPTVTLSPQLLVSAKSPLAAMLERVSGALPVLLSVTGWDVLLVPTR